MDGRRGRHVTPSTTSILAKSANGDTTWRFSNTSSPRISACAAEPKLSGFVVSSTRFGLPLQCANMCAADFWSIRRRFDDEKDGPAQTA